MNKNTPRTFTKILRGSVIAALSIALLGSPLAMAEDESDASSQQLTFDNLVPVKDAAVALAYIDPEADFTVFKRVAILEPKVAFRSNWQRDQNRSRTRNISNRDMERMKSDVATLFERVFEERLEAAGYEVVDVANDDVLLLRPAIVDLDVTAPDTRSPGRTSTFASTAGAATLYIELFDSITGEILGRAADRQSVRRNGGMLSWSNSVTNNAEARRMFGRWADTLVAFLDSHYTPDK